MTDAMGVALFPFLLWRADLPFHGTGEGCSVYTVVMLGVRTVQCIKW